MPAVLCVWVGLGAACTGNSPPPVDLPQLTARFQAVLDSLQSHDAFPGATAAFVLPDDRVSGAAAGLADVELGVPMTSDHKMLAASIGKTFVSAVALRLQADEVWDLDDPLGRWLGREPWFGQLPNAGTITVRALLQHRSGIPNHVQSERFRIDWQEGRRRDPDYAPSAAALVSYVTGEPALHPVGGFSYTDTGYILVGLAIERASGADFYQLADTFFIEPLQLSSTVPSNRRRIPELAQGYVPSNSFGLPPVTMAGGVMTYNPAMEWTGGGFASTPRDLVRWAKALYEGHAMSGPYLDELLDGRPMDPDNPGRGGYGLAVYIDDSTLGARYGHGGSIPGYRSRVAYFPDFGVAVALQINTGAPEISRRIPDYVMLLADVVAAAACGGPTADC